MEYLDDVIAVENEKQQFISRWHEFLQDVPDDDSPYSKRCFILFMNRLLRTKKFIPPTCEIMTLIKHEKPKLYHATRLHLASHHHLHLLFQISMDPELARSRLEEFMKTLAIEKRG